MGIEEFSRRDRFSNKKETPGDGLTPDIIHALIECERLVEDCGFITIEAITEELILDLINCDRLVDNCELVQSSDLTTELIHELLSCDRLVEDCGFLVLTDITTDLIHSLIDCAQLVTDCGFATLDDITEDLIHSLIDCGRLVDDCGFLTIDDITEDLVHSLIDCERLTTECPRLICFQVDGIGFQGHSTGLPSGSLPVPNIQATSAWVAPLDGTITQASLSLAALPRIGPEEYVIIVAGAVVHTFTVPAGITGDRFDVLGLSVAVAVGDEVWLDILTEDAEPGQGSELEFTYEALK